MEALYFTADWCQPCKVFGPIMERLNDAVKVKKIDIMEDMGSVEDYEIMSVPRVVFLKDGDQMGRFVGARTEDWVRDFIKELE
jgi:thioredoxin-like negative regulator of GroEL